MNAGGNIHVTGNALEPTEYSLQFEKVEVDRSYAHGVVTVSGNNLSGYAMFHDVGVRETTVTGGITCRNDVGNNLDFSGYSNTAAFERGRC